MDCNDDVINRITNGDYPPDSLAAIIPEMIRKHDPSLPVVLAHVMRTGLSKRWGFPGPYEYFNAIGVPALALRRMYLVLLDDVAGQGAHKAEFKHVRDLINSLKACDPEVMPDRTFITWLHTIEMAVRAAV